MTQQDQVLQKQIGRGVFWSGLNNILVRLGGLVVGIILARLLTPEAFGVYAVAMTVQLILVTLAELGISADLIRRGDIETRGPTVATIGLLASVCIAGVMCVCAGPAATLMGSEAATPVIQVMALTLVCSGLSVVPYAVIQRNFWQSKQLSIDATGLVTSTGVTLALIAAGMGPMALALGRVVAQLLTMMLQFVVTGLRPRFGWNRDIARQVLRFGLPIAAANLLSWVILNVDNIIVGHSLGPAALGLYVMAFNLSSFPMNAVGQTIRSVALPAFARYAKDQAAARQALRTSSEFAWALALPLGCLLLVFAHPLITFLYGPAWSGSAPVLRSLAAFGVFRVIFDLVVSFLYAHGSSRSVLLVQLAWLSALVPAMLIGIQGWGLSGAGWSHLVVAVGLLLPLYLVALARKAVPVWLVLRGAVRPLAACVLASAGALLILDALQGGFITLALGGTVFALLYALPLLPWVVRLRRRRAAEPLLAARQEEERSTLCGEP